MIFIDTETCGFYGPVVLLQYSIDDGPIHLHEVWREPIISTLKIIEKIVNHPGGVCGFNLTFDWFHICKLYTTLSQVEDKSICPNERIDDIAVLEESGRFGPCLKPVSALDLMLHARKGPYQATMDRGDVRIKRVPTALAKPLAKELDKRIPLKDVYFERQENPSVRWRVYDIKDDSDEIIPDFQDVVLKFSPSSALKALAKDALGLQPDSVKLFAEVEPPRKSFPTRKDKQELGWAPFATAVGRPGKWNGAWPDYGKINVQINHWAFNTKAREYASDDIRYLKLLLGFFSAKAQGHSDEESKKFAFSIENDFRGFEKVPMLATGDDDSELACMVGAVRWRGFSIDLDKVQRIKEAAQRDILNVPFNFQSPNMCKKYLQQVMTPLELLAMKNSTKGIILESIAKWRVDEICPKCEGLSCKECDEGVVHTEKLHPAAERANVILNARKAKKRIEVCDKLLQAKRFHASFKVIGALSSRMSGADGLNPQGIDRTNEMRSIFTLADEGEELSGGDFDGYEITLMDAAYGDPRLRAELQAGKKIHGLLGEFLFKPKTYSEILATSGLSGGKDLYEKSKRCVFAMAYGGEGYTISTRIGVPEEIANQAYREWCDKYVVWAKERKKIFDLFCSMKQPNGIGSKVEWSDPAPYIESLTGFKRYFTLENQICKTLFQLAEDPPKEWTEIKIKVVRRDRVQTACGALRSALFAAAFALQAANMRAAANHVIQSSGATITKGLQRKIWELQPTGINKWIVRPLNAHDEIKVASIPEIVGEIEGVVKTYLDVIREKVPLIKMVWGKNQKSWAK
jgi:hypothetical protein